MPNWVDFKEIKSRVRIDQVLEHYGLQATLKKRGSNLVGPCPIHKGTNPTQFHVSLAKNNFNCFGDCYGGGNVIDFVAKMEAVSIKQAALMLQEWFGGEEEGWGFGADRRIPLLRHDRHRVWPFCPSPENADLAPLAWVRRWPVFSKGSCGLNEESSRRK